MTLSRIRISIIIPTYNYGAVIGRALDSVLAQWSDDIELWVIDDGSADNTGEILCGYANRYPGKIQVVHQENSGPAAARNRGIGLARGEYALLLDADDELLPGALEKLRLALKENPGVGMVLGGQVAVYPDGRERLHLPDPISGSPPELIRRYLLEKRISVAHGRSLFRRDLLLQRPYPESLRGGEDIAVFAYLLVSAPVATVHAPLARIHKHADSLRHARHADVGFVPALVNEVFAMLPDSCRPLRRDYEARRYLSLLRNARSEDTGLVWRCFMAALRLSPVQALRWDSLARLCKYWVNGVFCRSNR